MTDNSKRTGGAIEAHYQFVLWLVPAVARFPKRPKFTLGDRIENTALDVFEALIDATYTKERTLHLRRANLGIEKLRFLLRLAADLRLLDRRRYEHAARSLDETGRLIGGWMKRIEKNWGQSRFNCRRSGLAFGGRPFGSGVTRRPRALAIRRLKRVPPTAHPPFVAARNAATKSASSMSRNRAR